MNKADTAFVLAAAGLVLLMTPGLALFYGGMVRGKNVLGTIMQSLFMIALISIEWVYLGYSMSFGPDVGGFIGNLSWFALHGVTNAPSPDYATTNSSPTSQPTNPTSSPSSAIKSTNSPAATPTWSINAQTSASCCAICEN